FRGACLNALVATMFLSALTLKLAAAGAAPSNWPQFRGPNCSGVALDARPPVKISPTNLVAWRIDVPWSPSSPSLWNNRFFWPVSVDAHLPPHAYDRDSGRLLWTRPVKAAKLETFHKTKNSPASATPATDGKHVVSYFGSFGLVCYDFEGKELWRHEL